jgi:hypothetical protein
MTAQRPSTRTDVVRVVDDGVVLDWRLVELLGHGRLRRLVERQLRVDGGRMPAMLDDLLDTLDVAARGAAVGSARAARCVEVGSTYEQRRAHATVDVATAARLLGIGHEAVRQRIRRGRLDAWLDDDGRWRIPEGQLR